MGDAEGRTRRRARSAKREDGRREHPQAAGPVAQGGQDFLLEIGCEELPADYLPAVLG